MQPGIHMLEGRAAAGTTPPHWRSAPTRAPNLQAGYWQHIRRALAALSADPASSLSGALDTAATASVGHSRGAKLAALLLAGDILPYGTRVMVYAWQCVHTLAGRYVVHLLPHFTAPWPAQKHQACSKASGLLVHHIPQHPQSLATSAPPPCIRQWCTPVLIDPTKHHSLCPCSRRCACRIFGRPCGQH